MKFPSSRLLRTSFSGLVCPQSPKEEPDAFPSSQHQATLGSSSSSSASSQLSQLTHFRPWDLMVQGHQVSLSQEGDTRQPPTTAGCPTAPAAGRGCVPPHLRCFFSIQNWMRKRKDSSQLSLGSSPKLGDAPCSYQLALSCPLTPYASVSNLPPSFSAHRFQVSLFGAGQHPSHFCSSLLALLASSVSPNSS